jgi:hypothetical protein
MWLWPEPPDASSARLDRHRSCSPPFGQAILRVCLAATCLRLRVSIAFHWSPSFVLAGVAAFQAGDLSGAPRCNPAAV